MKAAAVKGGLCPSRHGGVMRKFRNILIVLVTAAGIVAGGLLPVITAKVQDSVSNGTIHYDTMQEIRLNLRELSMIDKLFLVNQSTIIGISEGKTNLTPADVKQLVFYELQPYVQQGLMEDNLSDFSFECRPDLHYVIGVTEMSNVFWHVTMERISKKSQRLELDIDDKTGKIITITYEYAPSLWEEWQYDELLTDFYTIYFNRLGLKPDEGYREPSDKEHEYSTVTFRWGDMEYGEMGLEFTVYPTGFYNGVYQADNWAEKNQKNVDADLM